MAEAAPTHRAALCGTQGDEMVRVPASWHQGAPDKGRACDSTTGGRGALGTRMAWGRDSTAEASPLEIELYFLNIL